MLPVTRVQLRFLGQLHGRLNKIRRLLLLSLVAFQTLTVVTILVLSNLASERVMLDQAARMLATTTAEATNHTESFLSVAQRSVTSAALMFGSGVLAMDDPKRIENYFVNVLEQSAAFAGIYVGTADGEFLYVSRSEDSNEPYRVKSIAGDREAGAQFHWRSGAATVRGPMYDADDNYDPRVRPWYSRATATGHVIWTEPYLFFTAQRFGVTVAAPVHDESGVALGAIGVDLELGALAQFLDALQVAGSGSAFIADGDGVLIAAPFVGDQLQLASAAGPGQLLTVDTLADVAGREALRTVQSTKNRRNSTFRLRGTQYLVDHEPLKLAGGQTWMVATYAAEDNFLQAIRQNERRNILLALGVLLFSMLVGWRLAGSVWTPVAELHDQANRDQLTKLHNRHYLMARAEKLFDEAHADGTPIVSVIIDIDHFKKINDGHGHAVGDEVIIAVGQRLRRAARIGDTVARLGGEEFVMVLPTATAEVAAKIVNRIAQWFRDEPIETAAGPLGVTFSAGIAMAAPGEDFEAVLNAADRALYQAKQTGRNRVVVAPQAKQSPAEAGLRQVTTSSA